MSENKKYVPISCIMKDEVMQNHTVEKVYTVKEVVDLLNKYKKENEELKQEIQDLTDTVNNYFLEHEQDLSVDLKSQAHLELGVEFEYDY